MTVLPSSPVAEVVRLWGLTRTPPNSHGPTCGRCPGYHDKPPLAKLGSTECVIQNSLNRVYASRSEHCSLSCCSRQLPHGGLLFPRRRRGGLPLPSTQANLWSRRNWSRRLKKTKRGNARFSGTWPTAKKSKTCTQLPRFRSYVCRFRMSCVVGEESRSCSHIMSR